MCNNSTQLREKFRPVLKDHEHIHNNHDEAKVANAIKSLIELHRTVDRYLTGNPQPEAAQQMLRGITQQSCEWVRLNDNNIHAENGITEQQ